MFWHLPLKAENRPPGHGNEIMSAEHSRDHLLKSTLPGFHAFGETFGADDGALVKVRELPVDTFLAHIKFNP